VPEEHEKNMKAVKDYINLLPREEKKSSRAMTVSMLAVVLFVLAGLAVFGLKFKEFQDMRTRLGALTLQKQAVEQQLTALQKDLGVSSAPGGMNPAKAALIQNLLGERVLWSEVFKQFSQTVPRGLWFDSLEGSSAGKAEIKIRGGAFSYSTVSEFMLAMERSSYFEKPDLLFAQKTTIQGRDVIGFEIVCAIKKGQGAR
jgi:Tfp pilus assembly protein PilN